MARPKGKKSSKRSPVKTTKERIISGLEKVSKADTVFFLMPPLILLLAAGTLAQRWMGLYEAHKMFFSSFILWAGPIPLPGAYTLIGLITLSLTIKFLFFSPWKKQHAGIYISHLGALILLTGGLLTAAFAKEGYLLIPEGGSNAYVYDYHKRNLLVFHKDQVILQKSFYDLPKGKTFAVPESPLSISITDRCVNCGIENRNLESKNPDKPFQDMARFMALTHAEPEKDAEANLSGLTFELNHSASKQTGTYIAFDGMPRAIEIAHEDSPYKIIFGKEQRILPFSVALVDFKKINYPSTAMAARYHSDVIVKDGDLEWKTRIEMNKPLRYRGYTLYQSSFEETPETELTVLSVVENKGRLFPYMGTIVIGFGLALHFLLSRERKRRA